MTHGDTTSTRRIYVGLERVIQRQSKVVTPTHRCVISVTNDWDRYQRLDYSNKTNAGHTVTTMLNCWQPSEKAHETFQARLRTETDLRPTRG